MPVIGGMSASYMRLLKLIVSMFLYAHWNGCFQFLLAQLDTPVYNATYFNATHGAWPKGYSHGFHEVRPCHAHV